MESHSLDATSETIYGGLNMGYCKLDCLHGETECCIYCDKQDDCENRCDMMDSYEYAEDCEDYVEEGENNE